MRVWRRYVFAELRSSPLLERGLHADFPEDVRERERASTTMNSERKTDA